MQNIPQTLASIPHSYKHSHQHQASADRNSRQELFEI
jgi:hypothetical protein